MGGPVSPVPPTWWRPGLVDFPLAPQRLRGCPHPDDPSPDVQRGTPPVPVAGQPPGGPARARLARKFLAEFAGGGNRPDVLGFAPRALGALGGYGWPGNVRELRNVVERAVALCPGPMIQTADLPEAIRGAAPRPVAPSSVAVLSSAAPGTLSQRREEAEVRRITEALEKHRNNRLRAAAELGISRVGLYKKLRKYGLT